MARQPRKKEKQPLTIMIVPHSERPPISLRIPPWVTPLVLVILAALLVLAVSFAGSYYRLQSQLEELQLEREMEASRQREMRTTILSQQDEVRNLSAEVEQLEADLMEIERISNQIRELIGVEEPDLTSTPEPSSSKVDGQPPYNIAAATGLGGGSPHPSISPSNRSMAVVAEASQHVQNIGLLLPVTLQEQQILREQVLKRLEKIEPIKRHDPEALEAELQLLAAAPKRWPVDVEARITSRYGPREFKGKPEFHTGIDIGVWYSTEVKATKAGKVVFAGWLPRYGWTVEIEHEMGYSTIYAHHRYYFPDAGDEVEEGEVIALSGDSGDTTGPHLHYEIRLNGKPVDPMKYLDLGE
ncbi:MAG: peptidoglycan DD-metalloendopeptidase family protein [Anaerolineae bacterium]|nr:peptidoglycan DD-metalloendopeptidase family protein [Anaerolineae bacterium]